MKDIDEIYYHYHGQEQCKPEQYWGPGIKDHYKIHFIHRGKGIFQTESNCYTLGVHQGFLIHPHTIAHYKADEFDPWKYSWIAFKGEGAEDFLKQAHLNEDNPVFTAPSNSHIEHFAEQFTEASLFNKGRDLALKSVLYRFMAELIHLAENDVPNEQTDSQSEKYIKQAKAYIETHYHQKLSIAEIAQHLAVNRIYFTSLFKEKTGQTPQTYLLHFRMKKACQLMETPVYSIAEVGRSVGYNDPLLFSKMFKRVMGVSPTIYRNNINPIL